VNLGVGFRCLPDAVNGLTDEQCITTICSRLGITADVWNCETNDSLNSSINVAATWPNTFTTDGIAAGAKVYLQLHFNQSAGSGTASDLKWLDLLDATRTNHAIAVSQMQAYADRILTLGAGTVYVCLHHEPEDDAQANGFGLGDPILNTSTWQPAGTGNWTQPLTASAGDAGQATMAQQCFAAFVKAGWDIWTARGLTIGGSSSLAGRIVNFMSGSWESGHFGGASAWASAVESAMGGTYPYIISTDAYTQPGTDKLHIGSSGRQSPDQLLATAYSWAVANGRKLAIGEHGIAPMLDKTTSPYTPHALLSDVKSKAYYFKESLLPWLMERESVVEFVSFQGNVMVDLPASITVTTGGTYTGPVNIPCSASLASAAATGTAWFPQSGTSVTYDSVSGTNLHIPTGQAVTVVTGEPVEFWQGRHPYGDWDDGNQAACTAAMKTLVQAMQAKEDNPVNLFPYYKQNCLNPAATDHVDVVADNIKVALISGYTYTSANKYLADAVTSGATVIARSANLASKTDTNGTAGAANPTISAVASGHTITGILIYKDTGSDATSPLIAHIDQDQSAVALSLATNGSDITVSFSGSGIFDL
jgi:hypothetical protein